MTPHIGTLLLDNVADEEVSNNSIAQEEIYQSSDKEEDIEKLLASWAVNSKTPAFWVDALLRILKTKIPDLPLSTKTLLKTPRHTYEKIIPMCNGCYLHIGLENMLLNFLSKHNIASNTAIMLDVGIDGTNTSNSSDTELWPIMINVVGYEEVLVVGCFFGTGKPKDDENSSNEYMTPFVEELLEILASGGLLYKNEIIRLMFRAFVMDAPARAFIMNTLMYSGYNSCTKCLIPGTRISNRIIFHGVDYQRRTDHSFRNRAHANHHHSLDASMIEQLPIDCVKNVPIDPMHNIYLGVTKQLFRLWVVIRKKPYSISAKNIKKLTANIFDIAEQLPSEFCRKPRIMKFLKRYKATEFRQFALYTLTILLKDVLPKKYYEHFLKFHCAIRILSTPEDCLRNNALAHELLKNFVAEFGLLYGYKNLSHNVHSLLHLAEDVVHFQCPLDDYAAFKFENFLQYLKKVPRSNYRVLEQINNRFIEKFSVFNYEGDFKKRIRQNKVNKNGSFTDVYINNMHLSVKKPNNYILAESHIIKITKITKKYDGTFEISGTRVKNVKSFYEHPIPSSQLNIFMSDTNETCKTYDITVLKNNITKMARVKFNKTFIYFALLHCN